MSHNPKKFSEPFNSIYSTLKILSYRKLKLVDEYLLEGIEIVLFIEDEHRLLVIKGIDRAEAQWTIAVGNQYGIACDARRALVAIRECLDIRQQHKCKKCFFEDAFLAVYQVAGIMHSLTNLEFIVQWMVVGTCNTHTPMTDASVNRKFLRQQLVDILDVAGQKGDNE